MWKKRKKFNLQELQWNRNGTGFFVNLIMTSTVHYIKQPYVWKSAKCDISMVVRRFYFTMAIFPNHLRFPLGNDVGENRSYWIREKKICGIDLLLKIRIYHTMRLIWNIGLVNASHCWYPVFYLLQLTMLRTILWNYVWSSTSNMKLSKTFRIRSNADFLSKTVINPSCVFCPFQKMIKMAPNWVGAIFSVAEGQHIYLRPSHRKLDLR